ncbi:MAG: right-handed parallel beta-helix repeat-containing protein, partial [Anaerolineae bacterium]|nr:right-handed parallel beta-helix repeat-containing protein [Anaerolineae bacterium]
MKTYLFVTLILALMLSACGQPMRSQPQPAAGVAPNAPVAVPIAPVSPAKNQSPSNNRYDIGNPTLRDVWIDSTSGNDSNDGSTRTRAFRSLRAAWASLPSGTLTSTGYRLRLAAGQYVGAYLEDRHGTPQYPILIEPADGAGSVTFRPSGGAGGQPQLLNVSYVYLQDLTIDVSSTGGDGFQCERCNHILLRRMNIKSRRDGGQTETVKINQSQYIYIEDSDISGAGDNAFDAVAVQHGHLIGNRFSQANDWCAYLKGGSAYFRVEANEFTNCGTGGFTAGQGSGVQWMVSPWLHYEAYGIQFVNNIVHRVEGACFGVNGGYNVLFAFNTCYQIGTRSHIFEAVYGGRGCDGGDTARCRPLHNAGAWTVMNDGENFIPNRNVFVYNNIFYNPSGIQSRWQHFAIHSPTAPPANSNAPNPIRTDDNLQIRGNIIWNGPSSHPIGIEGDTQGCASNHPTCTASQLRADNRINTLQPQLRNPSTGDFRPSEGSNLAGVVALA